MAHVIDHKARRQRIGNLLLAGAVLALLVGGAFLLIERRLSLRSEIAFGIAGIFLLAFVLVQPVRTRSWITSRQVRYGSNAVLMTLVLLVILGLANVLADRHPYRVDVTAGRRLSLSPQTLDVLRALEEPVRIVGFFNMTMEEYDQARDLLEQYRYRHPELEIEFHDPQLEPSLARQWGVTEVWRPTVFLVYGERREQIHTVSEREVTSALVRLMRETQPVVYFLTGHGEAALEDAQEEGLSTLRTRMEAEGYQVAPLNLLVTGTVPSDADALVLAGPQRSLQQEEVDRLAAYVERGGAAILLLDPAVESDERFTQLQTWLNDEWGVAFRDDLVIDMTSYVYPLPTIPLAATYGPGAVGDGMASAETYFIETRSITHTAAAAGPLFTPLVRTSYDSWGETSWEEQEQTPEYDEGEDFPGPLSIAATLEDVESEARLVLFGDVHFITNVAVEDLGNADLFINSLNWLTEDETMITLRPQEEADRYVIVRSALVHNALFAVLVLLIPLLVVGAGVLVFIVRRMQRTRR